MSKASPEKIYGVARQEARPRVPDLRNAALLPQKRVPAIACVLRESVTVGHVVHAVAKGAARVVDVLLEHPMSGQVVQVAQK